MKAIVLTVAALAFAPAAHAEDFAAEMAICAAHRNLDWAPGRAEYKYDLDFLSLCTAIEGRLPSAQPAPDKMRTDLERLKALTGR